MQSAVKNRGRGVNDVTEERLDQGVNLQRKLDNDDLLDDNDMERILSRPSPYRRKLEIFEAPEFVQRLSNYQEATIGESVTFSGQYKAFPKPTVKWFKDEEEVSETSRHNIDLSSETEGIVRLIIQELIRQDEGAYKCKVENQEGVASTTGYLSVSGKSPDKGQTKKIAQDRVSTTPFLRPIAEQKSMEEREEKEYQCLPPSPLQEFMDKIRHGAKSMHGPIVYADLVDIYSDDDVIKDFDSETAGDEVDVFDEELGYPTPSASPVDEIRLEDAFRSSEDKSHYAGDTRTNASRSIYESLSLSIDGRTAAMTTQISGEDSAYDSDGQDSQTTGICGGSDPVPVGTNTDSALRNRRKKLTLQRSHAVELSDIDTSSGGDTATVAKISGNGQITPDVERRRQEKGGPVSHRDAPIKNLQNEIDSQMKASALGTEVCRKSAVDVTFGWIESPWIQFFTGFVMSAVVLALAADIPPAYLVASVIILSITSFVALERHLKIE